MLVVGGACHEVPGLRGESFLSLPSVGIALSPNDWRPRARDEWVRGLVFHTRLGLPVRVKAGVGPNVGWDNVLASRFMRDDRQASCHVAVDGDGSYACLADLRDVITYHAGQVNPVTIGVEMYQETDGTVYESTLRAGVAIADVVTRLFAIQRQYPKERGLCRRFASPSVGLTASTKLAYMHGGARGRDFCGVYGHRNATGNRGIGDPGDEIFELLSEAGYEGYLVDQGDDLDVWAHRQRDVGVDQHMCDGIAGPTTARLLARSGRNPCGVWVVRPGDEVFVPAE